MAVHLEVERISTSSNFLASAPTDMRPIIVCITVVLAIAGPVYAQPRRLVTNFNLPAKYQDLDTAPGMDAVKVAAFFDTLCEGDASVYKVEVAFNVETDETMGYDLYKIGWGAMGDQKFRKAVYPWSILEGHCTPLLESTWITDREVAYGPVVNNDEWRDWIMPVPLVVQTPGTNATTTMTLWEDDIQWWVSTKVKRFFKLASTTDAKSLVNSMIWINETQRTDLGKRPIVPACNQAWLTAVTASRTMIGVNGFRLDTYYWAASTEKWWRPTRGGESKTWMDVVKNAKGKIKARPRRDPKWKIVYSSAQSIKVEGLAFLSPDSTTNVQVHTRKLPHEQCY
jgi:hypothetical protein